MMSDNTRLCDSGFISRDISHNFAMNFLRRYRESCLTCSNNRIFTTCCGNIHNDIVFMRCRECRVEFRERSPLREIRIFFSLEFFRDVLSRNSRTRYNLHAQGERTNVRKQSAAPRR